MNDNVIQLYKQATTQLPAIRQATTFSRAWLAWTILITAAFLVQIGLVLFVVSRDEPQRPILKLEDRPHFE